MRIFVDGNNALYRNAWAFRELRAPDGRSTGAVYGMLHCLQRLRKSFKQAKIVVVWDGANYRKGWRFQELPVYKSQRKAPSDEMKEVLAQTPIVRQVLGDLAVCQVQADEIEADDLIGILAFADRANVPTVVYSSDYDFCQLMQYGIEIIRGADPTRPTTFETPRSLQNKFGQGITPELLLRMRALCGDKSDGIPNAMRLLGPVKALKYVLAGADPAVEFDELPKSVRQAVAPLKGCWENARRNYRVMSIALTPGDPRFTKQQRADIERCMTEVFQSTPSRVKRREVLGIFAQLGMKQAIENRDLLFSISC